MVAAYFLSAHISHRERSGHAAVDCLSLFFLFFCLFLVLFLFLCRSLSLSLRYISRIRPPARLSLSGVPGGALFSQPKMRYADSHVVYQNGNSTPLVYALVFTAPRRSERVLPRAYPKH